MADLTSCLELKRDLLLAPYTTFGIGGPAKYAVIVRTASEMEELLNWARLGGERTLIIGRGSNLLLDQRGFDGLAIINRMEWCRAVSTQIEVGAGYSFALLGVRAARSGFSGLEFAAGIPGSVGGAVFMNAGAGGQETAQHLADVEVLTLAGDRMRLAREELNFSYRTSPFQTDGSIVLSATFQLKPSDRARDEQLISLRNRSASQPLQEKSAGCIFRNPPGRAAGKIIDECGLKGRMIGGAQVSYKHGNFIVNSGAATSSDVLSLIAHLKEEVLRLSGIFLEEEVRYIPYC